MTIDPISPIRLPTIAQYGSTIPRITSPKSNATIIGTAGRKSSVLLVKSLNGNEIMLIGCGKNDPVIEGSAM